jgi:hypothetical protein
MNDHPVPTQIPHGIYCFLDGRIVAAPVLRYDNFFGKNNVLRHELNGTEQTRENEQSRFTTEG